MFRKYKSAFLLSALMVTGASAFAQQTAADSGTVTSQDLIMLLIMVMIVIAIVTLMLAITILYLVRSQVPATDEKHVPWWKKLNTVLTDAVPVEEEESIAMDHAYDGIRELDNNLPPWWKYGFYLSIFFAVVYLWHYHVSELKFLTFLTGPAVSTQQEYRAEMKVAEAEKAAFLAQSANQVNEDNVTQLTDATSLAAGKKTYSTLCVACHGELGQGGIGPNMTDNYWIHGGDIKSVFSTIKYGVAEKGMIAWQDQLSPREMHEVASYILTLVGTNPPGGKEPQGDPYVPQPEAAPDTSDAVALLD